MKKPAKKSKLNPKKAEGKEIIRAENNKIEDIKTGENQ